MSSYTVSELNDIIKKTIHTEFKGKLITITGEVSNVKVSGKHSYLTLKDDNTSVSVAFWNTKIDNEQGDNVEIIGRVDYYVKSGYVNIIGTGIKHIGVGSLHTEYEKIKTMYEKKGYFDNRRPLPSTVKKLGVVTSESGAALQDFLYVLKKNEFSGEVYIYDCIVQGDRCPASVASGIKFFNNPFYRTSYDSTPDDVSDGSDKNRSTQKSPNNDSKSKKVKKDIDTDSMSDDPFEIVEKRGNESTKQTSRSITLAKPKKLSRYDDDSEEIEVDLIVVTRGGGSFEDLIGFSHPKVIEAIYASKKYVISAVGHEVDSMLSDYVAHYRAPTPSIAGEVVCSINDSKKKIVSQYEKEILQARNNIVHELLKFKGTLKKLVSMIENPTDKLNNKIIKIQNDIKAHMHVKLTNYKHRLSAVREVLNNNDVTKLLDHGFVVISDFNGEILNNADSIFSKNVKLTHKSGCYAVKITRVDDNSHDDDEKNKRKGVKPNKPILQKRQKVEN